MGDTTMRLRSVALRMCSGVNRVGVFEDSSFGVPGECRCCGVKYGMLGTGVLRLERVIALADWCYLDDWLSYRLVLLVLLVLCLRILWYW